MKNYRDIQEQGRSELEQLRALPVLERLISAGVQGGEIRRFIAAHREFDHLPSDDPYLHLAVVDCRDAGLPVSQVLPNREKRANQWK